MILVVALTLIAAFLGTNAEGTTREGHVTARLPVAHEIAGASMQHGAPLETEGDLWTPSSLPPRDRLHHSIAYDAQSDRIVLFGGEGGVGGQAILLDDTWAYDFEASVFANLAPPRGPSARAEHAMAYDGQSDRIILFGGYDGSLLGDTWAYDVEANVWTSLTAQPGPPARSRHAMAYDAQADRVILVGGYDAPAFLGDTWAYDVEANVWTNLAPQGGMSARAGHAMAYDAQSDRTILFGGSDAAAVFGETWAYDLEANRWRKFAPPNRPTARYEHAMAYDAQSDRTILFGGYDGRRLGDISAYDFERTRWASAGRIGHGMAYDSQSDRIVLFGGLTDAGYRDDTWTFDTNTNTWTDVMPTIRPPTMTGLAMAYDAQSDRVILFGGYGGGPGPFFDETWAYDVGSNTWTNMAPSIRPQARDSHAMVYDVESDRVVVFGGCAGLSGEVADTWVYDFNANTWTNMNPAVRPANRFLHAMAYDAESDRTILFGGLSESLGINDETWSYDYNADTWTNMNPSVRPPARYLHAMSYDAPSDRIVMFSGVAASGPGDDTWSYDYNSNTWTNMNPAVRPSNRLGHAMAYDAESDRTVLFGGDDASGRTDETWSYHHPNFPSAPQALQAVAGNMQVRLHWLPPENDGASPLSNYRIYRGTSLGSEAFLTAVGDVLTYTDVGLTNGVTYYYQVSAVNSIREGPRTGEVSTTPSTTADTTKPTIAITSPTDGATLTSTAIAVSGTASDNVALNSVEVSTDGTTWLAASGTAAWSRILDLTEGPNTIYARATDSSGNTATASVSVTVTTPGVGVGTPTFLLISVVVGVAAVAAGLFAVWWKGRQRDQWGKPPG